MKTEAPPRPADPNRCATISDGLKSCKSKVERLEQFARNLIVKHMRTRSILETAVDGIVIISEKGIIQSFNPAAEKIFGYRQKEVIGHKVNMLMPEPHRSRHDQYIKSYVDTGRRKIIGIGRETKGRRKDGSTFPIDLAVSEVTVGGHRYFTGIIKDITERHRSASALKQSEERFRVLVEAMNDGLAVQDADGKIVYVNPRFCEILGYHEKCLMNKMVTEFMDTASQIVFQNELDEKGAPGGGMVELRMEKEDGDPLHVHVAAKALRASDGEYMGSFVVVTDVTQIKKLQRQLIQSQKMEAIGRLAGGVAHDFNNLLTVIFGNVDLSLQRLDKENPLYQNLIQIDEAAKRAGSLTRQLLAFSRKQVMQPVVLALNQIVSGLEKMLRRLIGEDIILTTRLDPMTGAIKADPTQIEQVIVNIAVNARDAMPGGGQLTIETHHVTMEDGHLGIEDKVPPGNYAMIAITDTGTGMDQETQARIFEPFYTTKEKGHGTGLGLSTVYGIVKQSGGEIALYSEPGNGTCFKIYLPLADDSVSHQRPEPLAPPVCGTATILVVEDEDALRRLVADVLKQCGYTVLKAPDGPTALEKFGDGASGPIDLILTDVVMPRMNGKALVSRLQPIYPEAKFLFISGYTDDAIVNHGVLAPGTPFLHKPFTPDQLIRKIQSVLDQD
jgi:two-component system, cell cycle sensor histidine kinase and response regulator CckA